MIDPATGASNNLFTYLQAGGNLWLFGQAPGRELSIQAFNPLTAANVKAQDFVFDLLGIRGNDTLFTNNLARRNDGEYNSFLGAVDPWPTPFVRQTATGRTLDRIPAMLVDQSRYDLLPPERQPHTRPVAPTPNEMLRGYPNGYNVNPDSATWQPIGTYRAVGSIAQTGPIDGTPIMMNGATTGWYKRGTTLTSGGRQVSAPYQLYYFGVPLHFMEIEEVRSLADVILSTRGWNVWRGSCPPQAPVLARDRQLELEQNLRTMSLAERRQFEQTSGRTRHAWFERRSP